MLVLRILSIMKNWIGIAYIRWGPLWRRKDHEENMDVLRQIYRALYNEYVIKRRLFLWIIPNEIFDSNDQMKKIIEDENYKWRKSNYRTILLNILPNLNELKVNLHKNWKRNLKKSEKNSLEIINGSDIEYFDYFLECFNDMASRKNFFAGFAPEDYKKIQKILPDFMKMRVFLCKFESKIIAALIISVLGDKAIYHAGATTTFGLKYYGSFLLHWNVIEWLKENNIKWYDLCGINPKANPGGFQFKSGLSGIDTYHIGEFEAYPNIPVFILITLVTKIRKMIILIRKYIPKFLP